MYREVVCERFSIEETKMYHWNLSVLFTDYYSRSIVLCFIAFPCVSLFLVYYVLPYKIRTLKKFKTLTTHIVDFLPVMA